MIFSDLIKAAAHKYIKRVPKGGGKGYVYYYTEGSATGHKIKEHMREGAAFKLTHKGKIGHFHIKAVDGERVSVEHDESGAKVTMTRDELAALLRRDYAKREKPAAPAAKKPAQTAQPIQPPPPPPPAPEPESKEPKKRAAKKPVEAFTFEVEGMNARGLKAMMQDAATRGTPANKKLATKIMESVDIKGDQVMIPKNPAERNATLQSIYSLIMGHSVGKDSEVLSRFGAAKNKRAIEALARKFNEKPEGEKPTSEKPTSEEPTSEKPTSEKPTSEKPTSEKPPGGERDVFDKIAAGDTVFLRDLKDSELAALLEISSAATSKRASIIQAKLKPLQEAQAADEYRVAEAQFALTSTRAGDPARLEAARMKAAASADAYMRAVRTINEWAPPITPEVQAHSRITEEIERRTRAPKSEEPKTRAAKKLKPRG